MGIRTMMITGDNPLTAAAIAAEAGVTAFSRGDPEAKLKLIRAHQGGTPGRHDRRRHQRRPGARAGRRRGGMNTGTQAAKEPATWWI